MMNEREWKSTHKMCQLSRWKPVKSGFQVEFGGEFLLSLKNRCF